MATLSDLTDAVYDMVYGIPQVERPAEDTLATAVADASDVSWQFSTSTLWNRGDYAESATGELAYLTADHTAGVDVTVRRAQRGTTADASGAIGDVYKKNPVYPRYVVERFINETVNADLWPHVYTLAETTVSFIAGQTTYELPADCGGVAQVYQADLNSDGKFYPLDATMWDFVDMVNTAESSTGTYLRLFGVKDSGSTVYVTYKQIPSSSGISSLSVPIVAMVPWRVVGKLLPGTRLVPSRTAPGRSTPIANQPSAQLSRDLAAYDYEFRRMRKDEQLRLRRKAPMQNRFRPSRLWGG